MNNLRGNCATLDSLAMDKLRVPVNELAKACANSDDSVEWREFLRRCVPVAARAAARVARVWTGNATASIIDDIVQEIFLRLCEQERRILKQFEPRSEDSFFALLRIVSVSVANDYFRRQHSVKRGGKVVTVTMDEGFAAGALAALDGQARMQKTVLLGEIDRTLRASPDVIAERDRAIFWLYYLQGLTAEEIAGLPATGLTAKGVESALRRVTRWLRNELEANEPSRQPQPAEEPG
jgi:RNA polymerase sigma-70 factor, ECF subfamily